MNPINNFFDLLLSFLAVAIAYAAIQIIKELKHPLDLDKYEQEQKNN